VVGTRLIIRQMDSSTLELQPRAYLAAALKRQSTESGAGRFTDFLLPPLTFSEYLVLRPEPAAIREEQPNLYALDDIALLNQQFVDYVNYGGYTGSKISRSSIRCSPCWHSIRRKRCLWSSFRNEPEFGHLVETALFSQRLHEDARLNYARWGNDNNEVDLVECSQALKPISALEIKWSDRYVDTPEALKGLMKFARTNKLAAVWATTRSKFGQCAIPSGELRQWPAKVKGIDA
jgi:predicted AAA+ superfamily ATPase